MTRQEFLEELRISLQGEINQGRINEHLHYYDTYIMEESRKGKTEQQVLEELGNPRLIAKTLIDTEGNSEGAYWESSYSSEYRESNQTTKKGFHANYSKDKGWDIRFGRFRLNSWYGKIVMMLLAILVIVVVARIVAFLLPLVIGVVLILTALSLIFGRRG